MVEASLAATRAAVHPSVLNHCIRGFYWACLFAAHKGVLNDADYDEELLFAAHVMHDLGTGPEAPGQLRFEMEGADLAATVLTGLGTPARGKERPVISFISPLRIFQSSALEAAARTRTRTSSGPGRGGSNSASRITSGPP